MMNILSITTEIADMHESGLYVVKHRRGDFKTDKERWVAAAADCGMSNEDDVAKCWKLYVKAALIADDEDF